MSYTKTTWTPNVTPVSAGNMNHIEQGISDAQDATTALQTSLPGLYVPLAGNKALSGPIQVQGTGALLGLFYNLRDGNANDPWPQPTDLIEAELLTTVYWGNKRFAGNLQAYYAKIIGYLIPQFAEQYTIYATSNDGVRVIVDGTSLFGEAGWKQQASTTYSGQFTCTKAGQAVPITIDHTALTALGNYLTLEWASASQTRQTIPASAFKWSLLPFENAPSYKNVYAYNTVEAARDMKVQGNSVWHGGNLTVSSSAPSNPGLHDLWIDTSITLS